MTENIKLPDMPYPGLLNYREDQEGIFAGREEDVKKCGDRLFRSKVLVLHGRTGCGKSSFLRAGLRPAIARSKISIGFADQQDLRVVRSGSFPLRKIAEEIYAMADDLRGDQKLFGPGDHAVGEAVIAGRSAEKFIEEVGANSQKAVKALDLLSSGQHVKPVMVVDQAEEIFTLFDNACKARVEQLAQAQKPGESLNGKKAAESLAGRSVQGRTDEQMRREALLDEAKRLVDRERQHYFTFLYRMARGEAPAVRIIISLRTEYKGELEERIADERHPGDGLKSYLLTEMNKKQLVLAIRRPTLSREEYGAVIGRDLEADDRSPFEKYGFNYETGLADEIATWLFKGDVPQGGLLPAMQVACLRLHKQTEEYARKDTKTQWLITSQDLNRLGEAKSQVREYLDESIGNALRSALKDRRQGQPDDRDITAELNDAKDVWYSALYNLVRLEPDGRATTESRSQHDLMEVRAESLFRNRTLGGVELSSLNDYVLAGLEQASILRREGRGEQKICTLGHDSLALALNQWHLKYGVQLERITKMGMNSPREFAGFKKNDLFGADAATLPIIRIGLPRDMMWDHQIPFFAKAKGFAERLGIEFVEESRLSALTKDERGLRLHRNWEDLRSQILSHHKTEGVQGRLMVASDFQSFPWMSNQFGKWTDILVTDIFMGNALIGAKGFHGRTLSELDARNTDIKARLADFVVALREILSKLEDTPNLKILTLDKASSAAFLKLACKLTKLWNTAWINGALEQVGTEFTGGDALFERFFELSSQAEKGGGAEGGGNNVFMIATAFGRAQATMANFQTYFHAQHLLNLVDDEVKNDQRKPDLIEMAQKIMAHTIWQIGVPASKWRDSENRAIILRLAALGYYTSEFIRTSADEFVNFLFDWVNNRVMAESLGEGITRVGRDQIRDSVQEAFTFLTFDEYPRVVFDLEAPRAYWWKEEEGSTAKAAAHEIYLELCRLRALTLEASERVTQHLNFLKKRGKMDLAELTEPLVIYKQAWRNYRIFNFFDSERFMRDTADRLQRIVDLVQRGVEGNSVAGPAFADQERAAQHLPSAPVEQPIIGQLH
jgi:hypothetical protein